MTTLANGRERLGSRRWADEAVRRVEADANRSADTHLHVLDVIQRDLIATLRETLRPSARLAASV